MLQGIRARPESLAKDSVEACQGYAGADTYTSFLRQIKSDFKDSPLNLYGLVMLLVL